MSDFDAGWSDFEDEAGPLLAGELKSQAPVSSSHDDPAPGTLADSMTWEDQGGVLTVGSRDPRGPIAAYVARGTGGHPIDPVNGEFLRFYSERDGQYVFARHVNHPGTAPNPFHIDAWEARREEVFNAFRRHCGDAVLAYLNPWRNRVI